MKRLAFVVSVLFVMSLAAGGAAAVLASGKVEDHHIKGEVTGVDAAAKTFTVKETLSNHQTKEVTFTAFSKMKVTIHGKPGTFEEVKAGDSIHVRYVNKGQVHEAHEISIVAPSAPAKKS